MSVAAGCSLITASELSGKPEGTTSASGASSTSAHGGGGQGGGSVLRRRVRPRRLLRRRLRRPDEAGQLRRVRRHLPNRRQRGLLRQDLREDPLRRGQLRRVRQDVPRHDLLDGQLQQQLRDALRGLQPEHRPRRVRGGSLERPGALRLARRRLPRQLDLQHGDVHVPRRVRRLRRRHGQRVRGRSPEQRRALRRLRAPLRSQPGLRRREMRLFGGLRRLQSSGGGRVRGAARRARALRIVRQRLWRPRDLRRPGAGQVWLRRRLPRLRQHAGLRGQRHQLGDVRQLHQRLHRQQGLLGRLVPDGLHGQRAELQRRLRRPPDQPRELVAAAACPSACTRPASAAPRLRRRLGRLRRQRLVRDRPLDDRGPLRELSERLQFWRVLRRRRVHVRRRHSRLRHVLRRLLHRRRLRRRRRLHHGHLQSRRHLQSPGLQRDAGQQCCGMGRSCADCCVDADCGMGKSCSGGVCVNGCSGSLTLWQRDLRQPRVGPLQLRLLRQRLPPRAHVLFELVHARVGHDRRQRARAAAGRRQRRRRDLGRRPPLRVGAATARAAISRTAQRTIPPAIPGPRSRRPPRRSSRAFSPASPRRART